METKMNYMTNKERQILQDELDDLRINKRKEIDLEFEDAVREYKNQNG